MASVSHLHFYSLLILMRTLPFVNDGATEEIIPDQEKCRLWNSDYVVPGTELIVIAEAIERLLGY